MKYINKKTQVVIETACVICGNNWELLKEPKKTKKSSEKKATKRKGD